MKIALIGAGLHDIPSKKFGAIEMILWNYKLDLERMGNEVIIFNDRNLRRVASLINNGNFDFVHLNYSEYVSFFLNNLKVPFCTTCHSGYITNRRKWSIGYYSVFYDTMRCPAIIALSEEIKKLYIKNGYKGIIHVLRNGIDIDNFVLREKGNERAICLGRIEPRKRQTWLAHLVSEHTKIDFIGPIEDKTFKAENLCRYMGFWMKEEVYKKLSEYSCLVLLSDGEAAPLVVPEAIAAGLSIVVSRSAAANLDSQLPFISILSDNISDPKIIAEAINTQIKNNISFRSDIIRYAKEHFSSRVVASEYLKFVEEFKNLSDKKTKKIQIAKKELLIYSLSKIVIFVKNSIRFLRLITGTNAPMGS